MKQGLERTAGQEIPRQASRASAQPEFADRRAITATQRHLAATIDHSPYMAAQRKLIAASASSARVSVQQATAERMHGGSPMPTQRRRSGTTPGNSSLPDKLKAGVERLSGIAMDDVQVHYNSARPAQLQALAFAQGTDIHLAPGQEQHLPHEAWHVVQQKQGRVRPTIQAKGAAINDDEALELEADVMGARALQQASASAAGPLTQANPAGQPVQRMVGFEIDVESHAFAKADKDGVLKNGDEDWDFKQDLLKLTSYGITVQFDSGTLELILPPIPEPGGEGRLERLFHGVSLLFQILAEVEDVIDFVHEDEQSTPELKIVYPPNEPFKRDRKNKDDVSGDGTPLSSMRLKRVRHDHDVFGDLQATAGVRFSAIGALADILTGTDFLQSRSVNKGYGDHSWDPKKAYGNSDQKDYVALASSRVLRWVASNTPHEYAEAEEIMGFLAILASYLITSDESQKKKQANKEFFLQDAKGIAPLMSRVSLGAVWAHLEEKFAWLTPDMVLEMAGVGDGALFGDTIDEEDYNYHPEQQRYAVGKKSYTEILRSDWLTAIIRDKRDLLSGLGDSISEIEPPDKKQKDTDNRTTTDFHMKNAVDVGDGRTGLVLELRRLPRHLDYMGLKALAQKIYRLVEAANKLAP